LSQLKAEDMFCLKKTDLPLVQKEAHTNQSAEQAFF